MEQRVLPQRASLGVRRTLLLLLVVVGVHALSPTAMVTDSLYAVPVAQRIVHGGTIGLGPDRTPPGSPAPYGTERAHGQLYPKFPWTVALFVWPVSLPLNAAHRLGLGSGAGGVADWRLGVLAMSLVVGLTAVLLEAVVAGVLRIGGWQSPRWVSVGTALVFAFATSAWSTASRSAWQHGPSMLCLTLGLWALLRLPRQPAYGALAGAAFATAYAVRPTNAISLAFFALLIAFRWRHSLASYAGGAAAVLVPFVTVNLVAYRTILPPYFRSGVIRGAHPLMGFTANLVSPNRGLLIFNPVTLLTVFGLAIGLRRGALRPLFFTMAAVVAAHSVAISLVPNWWGGWTYGPRYFVDMLPFLLVLGAPVAAVLVERPARDVAAWTAVGVLVAAGFLINAQGAWTWSSWCWNANPNIDHHTSRVWDWNDPQFLAGFRGIADHGLRSEAQPGISAYGCP